MTASRPLEEAPAAFCSLVGGLLVGLFADRGWAAEDRPAQEPRRFAAEYRQDFRNNRYDPRWLRVVDGPPNSKKASFRPGPQGLRVAIPRGSSANLRLGTGFQVRGDFEIIASYEVISAPRPAAGFGVGPELLIKPPGAWDRYASACRFVRTDGSEAVAMAWGRPADGKKQVDGRTVPAKSRSGRLRLTRAGTRVDYAVDDGETGQFRTVFAAEYGADDVEKVRLDTIQGGSSGGCEMVWKDLLIRADELPGLGDSETYPRWRVIGVAVLLSGLLAVGAWFLLQRRKSRQGGGGAGFVQGMLLPEFLGRPRNNELPGSLSGPGPHAQLPGRRE